MKPSTGLKKTPASSNAPTTPDFDLEEQIRQRAYQLFDERGMVDGHDQDDWLQAEQEIKAGQTPRTLKKSATA
jgi:regulation of enolase protein 1 (concanavalin A-like superfamily)